MLHLYRLPLTLHPFPPHKGEGKGARSPISRKLKPCERHQSPHALAKGLTPRDPRLAPVRLGLPALLHPRHHLRLRALFRLRAGARSGDGAEPVGLCDGGGGVGACRPLAGAGLDRRCDGTEEAVDRDLRPRAVRCILRALVRGAGAIACHRDCARRLCLRHGGRGGGGGVQQCHDPASRAAGALRPLVRNGLGDGLLRRPRLARDRAGIPCRRSRFDEDGLRIGPALRPRSGYARRRPHHRSVLGPVVPSLRAAAVSVHARHSPLRHELQAGCADTESRR